MTTSKTARPSRRQISSSSAEEEKGWGGRGGAGSGGAVRGQGPDGGGAGLPGVLHDEAPAHGVEGAAQRLAAAGAVGGQRHAVDVVGQDAAGQEADVGGGAEGDGADAVDFQDAGGLDGLHVVPADSGGNGLGLIPGQAHDDGAIGGVAAPGGAKRAVELDSHAGDGAGAPARVGGALVGPGRARFRPYSRAGGASARTGGPDRPDPRDSPVGEGLGEFDGEGAPGAHGADRVGGGGSDADAQQVEDTERPGGGSGGDLPGQESGGRADGVGRSRGPRGGVAVHGIGGSTGERSGGHGRIMPRRSRLRAPPAHRGIGIIGRPPHAQRRPPSAASGPARLRVGRSLM